MELAGADNKRRAVCRPNLVLSRTEVDTARRLDVSHPAYRDAGEVIVLEDEMWAGAFGEVPAHAAGRRRAFEPRA